MATFHMPLAQSPTINSEKPSTSGSENAKRDDEQNGPTVDFQDNVRDSSKSERGMHTKFRHHQRRFQEREKSDWWLASTGIPLLAATLGPLANVSSIAALVTSWRQQVYIDGQFVSDFEGKPFADPRWCYWLNVVSLICGFLGNIFLLFNFTQRIRYIIALPATILFWYIASGILIGITVCMQVYAPPMRPDQTYTQGFWYGIAAAAFYLVCSMMLMVNMLGYFLGHYPDSFALSDSQRTLILQTMVFFIYLAGGAGIISTIENNHGESGWGFADSMYFCDVTILTVGFGDLYPTTNFTRALLFPYAVGGIVTLALIVSSIYNFVGEMNEEKIVQKHTERIRSKTIERSVRSSIDIRQREREEHRLKRRRPFRMAGRPEISGPHNPRELRPTISSTITTVIPKKIHIITPREPHILVLREEKDRFEAMRAIQHHSKRFRKWIRLVVSVTAFGILWCIGAVVFWQSEKNAQGMTYFQALYFCYVSLLTIGYGDMAPKTNAGRTFFVVWSLIAVPTMTILVSDMGNTVVAKFKKWSDRLADFTVLPKHGIWRKFIDKHPWLLAWLLGIQAKRALKKKLERGFDTTDPDSVDVNLSNVPDLEKQIGTTNTSNPALPIPTAGTGVGNTERLPPKPSLSCLLATSIKRVAADMRQAPSKRYEYEEWVEFTRLIRSSHAKSMRQVLKEEEEEGLVGWDWIGEDSPMMSGMTEPEWLLNRLCESLVRLEKRMERKMLVEMRGEGKKHGKHKGREGETRDVDDAMISGANVTDEKG